MNRNKTLIQLYSEHKGKISDKWTRYLWEYDILFNEIRDKSIRILEIGVQNGGGLEIWSDYFGDGLKFIGCDINPECAALRFDDPRIHFVLGDANTATTQEKILSISRELDIVIDDGSHCSGDIIRSFLRYFPNIVDGGIYVAEDLHASYWREYEGGLFDPFSSITFFKRLVDIINSEHWGIGRHPTDILAGFGAKYGAEFDLEILQHIHSIKFVNSLCIIFKSQPLDNQLGPRFVAGCTATVCADMEQFKNSLLVPHPQNLNPWSIRTRPPEEEITEREEEIKTLSADVKAKEQVIQSLKAKLEEIHASRAWQILQILKRFKL